MEKMKYIAGVEGWVDVLSSGNSWLIKSNIIYSSCLSQLVRSKINSGSTASTLVLMNDSGEILASVTGAATNPLVSRRRAVISKVLDK